MAVFGRLYPLLRNGAFLAIIVQNVRLPRRDGAHRLGPGPGPGYGLYVLRQERIWVQDQKMLGIWGYPTTYVSNVHHHYCLVFQKINLGMLIRQEQSGRSRTSVCPGGGRARRAQTAAGRHVDYHRVLDTGELLEKILDSAMEVTGGRGCLSQLDSDSVSSSDGWIETDLSPP